MPPDPSAMSPCNCCQNLLPTRDALGMMHEVPPRLDPIPAPRRGDGAHRHGESADHGNGQEVKHARAGHEHHREQDEEHDDGRAVVLLQNHQQEQRRGAHDRPEQTAPELANVALIFPHPPRKEKNQRQFRKLGGLVSPSGHAQPARRAVDPHAHMGHKAERQQHARRAEKPRRVLEHFW